MRVVDCEQGSPKWKAVRCGKVTASRAHDVGITLKSGGYGARRGNYMAELIAELLTSTPADCYIDAAMAWGTEKEPQAIARYELENELWVRRVGFVLHPELDTAGASPDGLVVEDGLVQIKCPLTATHIDTLLHGKIDACYITQMQMEMLCAERRWCDFVSYDPRMPENMQFFVKRVYRDEKAIAKLESEIRIFLADLDEKIAGLTKLYGAAA